MSKIEWTGVTWNPVTGCNKVSRGCKNCYAEVMHKRLQSMGQPKYKNDFLAGAVTHEESLKEPFKWKKPRTVFVNSMSDLFHEDVPFWFIDQVFAVMAKTPQHTYQILTKRPEIMAEFFKDPRIPLINHPLPNVWLGTSVEDQKAADERIPLVLQCPAAVHFLSCEPLLGPVDIDKYLPIMKPKGGGNDISWVIAGGESGPKAQPMHPDWIRTLRDQCQSAGVPFFFKQWGEYLPFGQRCAYQFAQMVGKSGPIVKPWDDHAGALKIGKKNSGNILDGKTHQQFPKTKTPQPAES